MQMIKKIFILLLIANLLGCAKDNKTENLNTDNLLVCTGLAKTCYLIDNNSTKEYVCTKAYGTVNIKIEYNSNKEQWDTGIYQEIYYSSESTQNKLSELIKMCSRNNCDVEKVGSNIVLTIFFTKGDYPDYSYDRMIQYFENDIQFANEYNYKCK